MLLDDFSYYLPENLISKVPAKERSSSRLLYLNGKNAVFKHCYFYDLLSYLNSNDLLVMNNTKVIPARIFANKETGGKIEILLERILSDKEALVQIKANKSVKINSKIIVKENIIIEIIEKIGDLFKVRLLYDDSFFNLIYQIGQVPLPPYINRHVQDYDENRYQTIYAKHPGSVAAPTAGLHFDKELLSKIKNLGVDIGYVTLHVGAGTFKPIKTIDISSHKMHKEFITVSKELCDTINKTKEKGGRIVAVGTTTVRALETAALDQTLQAFSGDTDLFINPGFKFKVVDALITNFHLPKSTLLILTCAFGGYDNVLMAYQEAIKNKYRFYSYGDAMFIEKKE